MFCPFCGSEYTEKLNYCKRCGENLHPRVQTAIEANAPRLSVAALATALTVFGLGGLSVLFSAYYQLVKWGLRGDELIVPFMASLLFVGGVSGFLIYLLARLITAAQHPHRLIYPERSILPESRQFPGALPVEPRRAVVEMPSVTETTTRQFGAVAREPVGRE